MKQRPLEVSPDLWSIRRKVKLIDGILIYEEGEQRKWILPKTLRRKALILAHDSHRGTEGALSLDCDNISFGLIFVVKLNPL
jgi:hypothetical protein